MSVRKRRKAVKPKAVGVAAGSWRYMKINGHR